MKISKTAAAAARRLFGLCQTDGRLDEAKLRQVIERLVESKVRDYRSILAALHRLTRIDLERRKVTIESAVALDEASRQRVVAGLVEKYGNDLEVQYQVTPALLGGLRIRVGDDVFDGSVQGRIDRFAAAF
ncbi:F0F1 ATP synthase subunit delta [Luteolibacter yonseiensis]|uniref:F0F1 ATP synthase subunit delta n=1 Tax=Luteolibacter yonseiensis TaxID=1144680 RepID=A0A934V7N4_9BACT|nr:F0F1 ATP synthase subunit delta [Luteolibacter yonseiensis]MBK1816322.1 F0F1 ATP synthase subunit delta [Luteolibacter yonseiensis]